MRALLLEGSWICGIGLHFTLILCCTSVGSSNIREAVFEKSLDVKMDMSNLSTGWKDFDLMSCVSSCLRNYISCQSVKFNKSSKHCTPGSWVFQTNTRRDDDLHLLYSPGAWCGHNGYTVMKEFNGVRACLLTWNTPINYESSRSQCQVKGASLYTMKVPEKLKILEITFYSNYESFWVGLINFGQGVLRWVDGGPMLTVTDLESLFRQGDLLDYTTHTKCVIYITGLSKLGFAECDQLMKVVCEKYYSHGNGRCQPNGESVTHTSHQRQWPMSSLFVRAEEDMLFEETEAGEFHMADFDVVWRDVDLLTCVIRCVGEFRSCYSVTYDETTNMCTPGSWLVLNHLSPLRQAPGKIYSTGARCNEASKFKYYRQDDVATCYWASDSMLNYKDSKGSCSANSAHLYTIKLMEKLTILKKVTSGPNGNYWIGLDDIREEDVFRWADDDSRLSGSLRQELFSKYQPDNWNNTEDCAYLKENEKLNDENCLHPFKFVCEMSPFQK